MVTMMRFQEPGWKLLAMHDPAGRRGIWYRLTKNGQQLEKSEDCDTIEFCAGREGDDGYVKLYVGQFVTLGVLMELMNCIERAWPMW